MLHEYQLGIGQRKRFGDYHQGNPFSPEKAKHHKEKSFTMRMFQAMAAGTGASDNLNLEGALDDHVSSHLILQTEDLAQRNYVAASE